MQVCLFVNILVNEREDFSTCRVRQTTNPDPILLLLNEEFLIEILLAGEQVSLIDSTYS